MTDVVEILTSVFVAIIGVYILFAVVTQLTQINPDMAPILWLLFGGAVLTLIYKFYNR